MGSRLYDLSRDSSVGGSGAQRWGDPSTWGGDGDHFPVVQAYNILRGIRVSGQWLNGLQTVSAPRLPAAHWIGEIAKCRATTPGLTERRSQHFCPYRDRGFNGNRQIDRGAGNGQHRADIRGRGIYRMHVGTPPEPVMTIDDGDLLSTESQSYTVFPAFRRP